MTEEPRSPQGPAEPAALPEPLRGLYRLPLTVRLDRLAEAGLLDADLRAALAGPGGLDLALADRLVENAVGLFALPLGLVTGLRVDGRERLAVLATEEPSVVAACCRGAALLRAGAGIATAAGPALMTVQLHLLEVPAPETAASRLHEARAALLAAADRAAPGLAARGGGARALHVRILPPDGPADPLGTLVVVHVDVDVCDAMGANVVNTIGEALQAPVVALTGGRVRLAIVTNLADRRLVEARGAVPLAALARVGLAGPTVAAGIVEATAIARRDPYRAATHNKGILNGIDGLLIATGQDFRAVEAGAHAFAAAAGRYTALSDWQIVGADLVGQLRLPLAVGTVGGAARAHPVAAAVLRWLGCPHAADLARLAAAVGLAQNLAALSALVAEGIQAGHMALHRRVARA